MPNLLTLKKLTGIHFVDKGAAIGPRVLVIKRDKTVAEEDPMSFEKKLADAVAKAVSLVLKEEGGLGDMTPQQMLERALAPIKDESTKAGIMAAIAALQMAAPAAPAPIVAPAKVDPEPEPPKDEPAAKVDPEPVPVPPKDEPAVKRDAAVAEVLKSLKPEERAVVEAAMAGMTEEIAKRKDLGDRLTSAEEVIAKSAAKAEMDEQIVVAKSFPLVPGDFKKRAAVLLTIKKQDEKAYAEQVASFKATQELLAKGKTFKTRGSTRLPGDEGGDDDDGETAEEQLDRLATELVNNAVEKGEAAPPTYEVAYARIVKMKPELLVQAGRERRERDGQHVH